MGNMPDIRLYIKNRNMEAKVLTLIDNTFTPEEAGEVLYTLLNHKIIFLNSKIFTMEEMGTGDTEHLKKRVKELQATKKELMDMVRNDEMAGCTLDIDCTVNIKVKQPAMAV